MTDVPKMGFVKNLIIIFAIIGGVFTTIQFTQWILNLSKNDDYALTTTIENAKYYIPDNIVNAVKIAERSIHIDSIPNLLIKVDTLFKKPLDEYIDLIMMKIRDDYKFYDSKSFIPDGYKEQWILNISNTGDKEITQLQLNLPTDGDYKIIKSDKIYYSSFNKIIELGSIRPTDKFTIIVWPSFSTLSSWEVDKIKLTHPNGSFGVEYLQNTEKVSRIWGWLYNNRFLTIMLLLIIIYVSLLLGSTLAEVEAKNKMKETKQPESDQTNL